MGRLALLAYYLFFPNDQPLPLLTSQIWLLRLHARQLRKVFRYCRLCTLPAMEVFRIQPHPVHLTMRLRYRFHSHRRLSARARNDFWERQFLILKSGLLRTAIHRDLRRHPGDL